MRVKSELLNSLHLDSRQLLLSARGVQVLFEFFTLLDVRGSGELDDVGFTSLMQGLTDLSERDAYKVFDIFDVDGSGSIGFDEFYLIACMLIALKDGQTKQFLWNHSRTCFELIDTDGSNAVSRKEFERFAFMFSIGRKAAKNIFSDFDKDNSEELDYEEFRMFTMACLDKQNEINESRTNRQDKRSEENS